MSRRTDSAILLGKIITDTTIVATSWVCAYYVRFYGGFDTPLGVPPPVLYFKLIPFIAAIWFATFALTGFYRRSRRKRSAVIEAFDVLQSSVMATLAFIAFSYFYEEYRYSRLTLVIFAALHPVLIVTGRSMLRKALRRARRLAPPRRVLVIGGGSGLGAACSLARDTSAAGTVIAGAVLIGDAQTHADDSTFLAAQSIAVLAQPEEWLSFLATQRIQAVFCAVPLSHGAFLAEHLAAIADQVPDIRIIPDLSPYTRLTAGVEMAGGLPVISLHESPLEGVGSVIKRLVDVVGAVIAIILLAPIMILVGCLVPFTSPGPVLYRQERMGLDGQVFGCLKFRSMPVGAERETGAVFASASDSRATWLGRVLRRTSIDELPQLFNVLRGDMSLVGPRPERPVFVGQFRGHVPGYMLRHKVKAGMTGWAQVNGWRGNTSIEKRIEFDLFYIQNWSVWLDVKILVMTVQEVLFGHNAY